MPKSNFCGAWSAPTVALFAACVFASSPLSLWSAPPEVSVSSDQNKDRWLFKLGLPQVVTVEDSKNNLGHRWEKFDPEISKLSPVNKKALSELFAITDEIAVLKALTVINLASGGKMGLSSSDQKIAVKNLITKMDRMSPPAEILPVHQMVKRVLQEQEAFQAMYRFRASNYRPRSSLPVLFQREYATARISENLKEAAKFLQTIFPDENKKNRQSFYDHLIALDPSHVRGE